MDPKSDQVILLRFLIGWEISEQLEFRPGKVVVNVHRRPKHGSPDSIAAGNVGVVVGSHARSSH